ncbi:MAG: SUMF1/EgtB/PvdO family nonheme iron enzyme [Anaerolineae bacterium]|nr:SUMF1/EgtB/PvdO family nonheme iron enzyme [Anaerolineae bacterium]
MTQSKHPITGTTHTLPFDKLSSRAPSPSSAHITHIGEVTGPVHTGSGDIIMVTGEGAQRDKELAYLDGLLRRYEYWRDHYTPLAGIAEVRAAVEDGPRLDLPMPFIPPGFEKLVEHGYGERVEVRREPVDDLRTAVAEHRRIVLLGDPGSGKTTTLWRLAYDYGNAARADGRTVLPLLVPLGGYTDDGPFDAYLARHLGPLAPYLETYRASARLILLLDGLNEMPRAGYAERVNRIRDVLDRYPDEIVVVTCRALDYVDVARLERLQEVEVSPLDGTRIQAFLHNYLGETAGERLFWAMAGDEVRDLWDTWQRAGGTWAEFWTAEEMPPNVYSKTMVAQDGLWARLRKEPPPLLALGRNPYLLLMTAQVYASAGGELPANRARLFAAFVDTLLGREKKRRPEGWIEAEDQEDGLAALAYVMQEERGRGTTVEHGWAVTRLGRAVPGCDAGRLLYLSTSATLLDADDATVRFYHQLLQEYFAAREMGRRVAAGEALDRYWPPQRWWEPSGREEATILLAGMEPDASTLLEGLAVVNPVVAARCLVEGGAQADEAIRRDIVTRLVARATDGQQPPVARTQAGDALARLSDLRPGVGVDPTTGLPDVVWCDVPAGSFLMGSDKGRDPKAYDDELPQHEVTLLAFSISRYPVTNAQYAAFVEDGGYTEKRRRCWTEAGWRWKKDRVGPKTYGGVFNLRNHPVVGVTWYEAVAFCCWLTGQLHQSGELRGDEEITLPTESQWEKAARGADGRIYPWGDDPDPNRANYGETGIGTMSAVGCFPGGASPYGVEDLSGNVWEWCRTKWEGDYEDCRDDDDLAGEALRVVRGGSFDSNRTYARCASRGRNHPYYDWYSHGFRVVVSPISPASAL